MSNLDVDTFHAGQILALHRHARAYAALVIQGEYEEASLDGRYACRPGSLVIHPAFHAHANAFGWTVCSVVNLPLPDIETDLTGYRIAPLSDPEALLRVARRDRHAAGLAALEESVSHAPIAPPDWLSRFLPLLLQGWQVGDAAKACGVTPEHASRTTAKWLGANPSAVRREGRIRRAIRALRDGAAPSEAAAEAGFADQPHLTRILKSAVGRTPTQIHRR